MRKLLNFEPRIIVHPGATKELAGNSTRMSIIKEDRVLELTSVCLECSMVTPIGHLNSQESKTTTRLLVNFKKTRFPVNKRFQNRGKYTL